MVQLLLCAYAANAEKQTGAKTSQYKIKADSVTFISQPSGFQVAGTVSYPSFNKKYPAIILIAGSGPHTRQEMISNTPVFDEMAAYFNQSGYAVMRIDKRGCGLSQGPKSVDETTSAQHSEDIYHALQFLKKHKNVDRTNIGLIGHSEGAWIAEMVALRDTTVKWMTLMGAHIVNGGLIQEDQMATNMLGRGTSKEIVEKVRLQIKRLFEFIVTDNKNDSMFFDIGKDFLLAHGMKEENISNKFINQLLDGFRLPWSRYFFSEAPLELIKQLKIPVLFIYGNKDNLVSPGLNILPLIDIMKSADSNSITLTVLPDEDHFFLHYNGRSLEKHKPGEMHVSKNLLRIISNWLKPGW